MQHLLCNVVSDFLCWCCEIIDGEAALLDGTEGLKCCILAVQHVLTLHKMALSRAHPCPNRLWRPSQMHKQNLIRVLFAVVWQKPGPVLALESRAGQHCGSPLSDPVVYACCQPTQPGFPVLISSSYPPSSDQITRFEPVKFTAYLSVALPQTFFPHSLWDDKHQHLRSSSQAFLQADCPPRTCRILHITHTTEQLNCTI